MYCFEEKKVTTNKNMVTLPFQHCLWSHFTSCNVVQMVVFLSIVQEARDEQDGPWSLRPVWSTGRVSSFRTTTATLWTRAPSPPSATTRSGTPSPPRTATGASLPLEGQCRCISGTDFCNGALCRTLIFISARVWLSDIPDGDGNVANLFWQCSGIDSFLLYIRYLDFKQQGKIN